MKQRSSKKGKIGTPNGKTSFKDRLALKIIIIILGAVVLFTVGWFSMDAKISRTQSKGVNTAKPQAQPADYEALIGRWQRPDGGYILEIRGVGADGRMDAAYYNPNPIYVARAEAAGQGDAIHIFVELQDKGYPGATYQLLYQKNQKILTGLYYQPAVGGSFDVYFVKME